jgi:hypothetical protein
LIGSRPLPIRLFLFVALGAHLLAALVLLPVTSHPFDIVALTGPAEAWLRWGFSPLFQWKFGLDYLGLTLSSQAGRLFLVWLGVPGIVAAHVAWKLVLVAANLLSALVLYRLSYRFIPHHARLLAALWLANPAVLWVSAGHGQVESVAALSVFSAIALSLSGRLFWAGAITGLGTGIEYFPLAVAAAVLIWWRGGLLQSRQVIHYVVGVGLSLGVCFVPELASPIGRAALTGGLASSSGFDVNNPSSLLTIWTLLGTRWSHYWPILFILSAFVLVAVMFAWKTPSWERGIVAIAGSIVLVLLWDANSLPQFALIAATALYLLAVVAPVNPLLLVGLPTAGLSTYFLWLDNGASTPNAFFFDDWSRMVIRLWEPPQSAQLATQLSRLFAAGLLVTFGYALYSSRFARKPSWLAALAASSAVCLALCIWAAQPVFWIGAFSAAPTADLPDFSRTIMTRPGVATALGVDTFRLDYSGPLVRAAKESTIEPAAGFHVTTPDLFSATGVGDIRPAAQWGEQSVVLPEWNQRRGSVTNIRIEVLIGSPDPRQALDADTGRVQLLVNKVSLAPAEIRPLATGRGLERWARANFVVPSAVVDPTGALTISVAPGSVVWDGLGSSPWMRVLPESGTLDAESNGQYIPLAYHMDENGQGYATGLPVVSTQVVTIPSSQSYRYFPPGSIGEAVLRWPPGDFALSRNVPARLFGGIYLLVLTAGSAALILRLVNSATECPANSTKPTEARAAARIKDSA